MRAAVATDLPRITEIWCLADGLPAMGAPYALHVHELETATLLVAEPEGGGDVVGFGAVLRSSAGTFLADLFVDPASQSAGVGRALLSALFADVAPGEARWTSASGDERALVRYIRCGMTPRWPIYALHGPLPHRGADDRSTTSSLLALPVDLDALSFAVGPGEPVVRAADLRYWRSLGARGFVVRRHGGGAVVARAVALPHSRWHPVSDAVRLGPVVALPGVDAAEAVAAVWDALGALEDRADTMRMFVPGPHPILPVALAAGFRLVDVATFCSSDPARLDPTRVLVAPDLT